ncbi:hypothetical protein B0H10DRAFT_2229666 [Mycena sp. CBHHK59/15]|nr:hypothetical protein B0H10DRAFT_2229666 [Mycena sp. CBHHK59/15]
MGQQEKSPHPRSTATHDAHHPPHARRLRRPSIIAGTALIGFERATSIFAPLPPPPLDARLDASPTRRLPPPTSATIAAGALPQAQRLPCAHRYDDAQHHRHSQPAMEPLSINGAVLITCSFTATIPTAIRSSRSLPRCRAPGVLRAPPPAAQRSHRPFFVTRFALIGCARTTTHSAWAHPRFSEHARSRFANTPRTTAFAGRPCPTRSSSLLGLRLPDISTLLHAASVIHDRDALDARGSPDSQLPETPAAFQGSTPAASAGAGQDPEEYCRNAGSADLDALLRSADKADAD